MPGKAVMSSRQAAELDHAMERNGWTASTVKLLSTGDNLTQILPFLEGRARIIDIRDLIDPVIQVDRSIKPTYPDWVGKVMDVELESTGPAEYDLDTDVIVWPHDQQESDEPTGQTIYNYLKKSGLLVSCLSLRDAEEIQKKGVDVFRELFGSDTLYFWKSVVKQRNSQALWVPGLSLADEVILDWRKIDDKWHVDDLAARF
jgi:hypothetical protein